MIYGNIHNMEEFSCLEEKIKEWSMTWRYMRKGAMKLTEKVSL